MYRKVLITLGILCLLASARAKADSAAYAYCPLGEGYVFLYDTVTGFQVVTNLKCGERLEVLDASDSNRVRVRTARGAEGYVLKSSITAVPPGGQRAEAPAMPPSTTQKQPSQTLPPIKSQPQAAPPSQPQAAQTTQPMQATQAQPVPQPQPQPQLKPEAQSQPQTESQPMLPAAPKPESPALPAPPAQQQDAEPKPQAPPRPQPQLEARAIPEPEPEPEAEAQPETPQPEPKPKSELKASQQQAQANVEPPAAATAFTPFSRLGYDRVPRLEAYFGYSFMNAGTSGLASRQNLSGFETSAAVHVNTWIAGEASLGAYFKTLQIVGVGTFPFHNYMALAGPRVNIRKAFFHALVGIDHLAGSANFYSAGSSLSNNPLAAAAGGGVQWNVSRQFALRTAGDYVISRFGGLTQNNFRVTLGLVFQAGTVSRE